MLCCKSDKCSDPGFGGKPLRAKASSSGDAATDWLPLLVPTPWVQAKEGKIAVGAADRTSLKSEDVVTRLVVTTGSYCLQMTEKKKRPKRWNVEMKGLAVEASRG